MTIQPRAILLRRHRLALWERPLWIILGAFLVDVVLAYFAVSVVVRAWTLGVAFVAAVAARFVFRPTLRDTARALDARAGTHNRLEALAACDGRTDPLARAIGEETASHFARRPLPRPIRWLGSLALLAALVALQYATLDLSATRSIAPSGNLAPEKAGAAVTDAAKAQPPSPVTMPVASLRWIEPLPGITATPTENVPMLAESDSAVALTNLTLRLTLAGEVRPPLAQREGIAAGVQSVPLALDLATMECRPFMFVTYWMTVERVRDRVSVGMPPWPDVVSSLQVIQIRPVGSELALVPPPEDDAAADETERLLFRTKRLKLAQIEVLKTTFAAAHATVPRVQEIAAQERALWQDAAALIAALEKNTGAAAAREPLRAAHTEVQKAWDELARAEPAVAFTPADRALAHFAEVERILSGIVTTMRDEKKAAEAAAAASANANAVTESAFEFPPRSETPAGRIETLAREQQELADQLAQGTANDAFARENKIARALPTLAAEAGFPSAIASAISSAASDAAEAAKHLNERDPRAATEPATRAAQTLQAIRAALDASGNARAAEELAEAQRELNRAALAANDGDAASAVQDFGETRRELREEALHQQEYGSASAAQQLVDTSNAMDDSRVNPELSRLAKQPSAPSAEESAAAAQKLTQLAQRAASARKQVQSEDERAKALAEATEELRRAQANAQRAAQAGEQAMKDLFEQAQENAQQAGESLPLPPPEGSPPNDQVRRPTQGSAPTRAPAGLNDSLNTTHYARDLSLQIGRVVELLAEQRRQLSRTQVLTTATPADAPPSYRPAVAEYFESLTRAGSKPAPGTSPAPSAP